MSDNSNHVSQLQKNNSTIVFSNQYMKRNKSQYNPHGDSASESIHKKMILFILGMVERVDFAITPTVIVGRFDWHLKSADQLDLSTYGAVERGVSRTHCRLEFIDDQVVVTDLGSANGTYIGDKRLEPNQPFAMKKGEELIVGRLPIQFIAER